MAHVEVRGQLFRSLSFLLIFEAGSLSLLLLLCHVHQLAKDCPVSPCLSSRHRRAGITDASHGSAFFGGLRMELRLSALHSECFYLLSHLPSLSFIYLNLLFFLSLAKGLLVLFIISKNLAFNFIDFFFLPLLS